MAQDSSGATPPGAAVQDTAHIQICAVSWLLDSSATNLPQLISSQQLPCALPCPHLQRQRTGHLANSSSNLGTDRANRGRSPRPHESQLAGTRIARPGAAIRLPSAPPPPTSPVSSRAVRSATPRSTTLTTANMSTGSRWTTCTVSWSRTATTSRLCLRSSIHWP